LLADHKTATSHLDFCFSSHGKGPKPTANALPHSSA
jgi:hypothetical protein